MPSLHMSWPQIGRAGGDVRSLSWCCWCILQVRMSLSSSKIGGGCAAFSPPTVAETKQSFLDAYNKPVSAMYNTVVQELLVQQHFMRYNIKYKYDQVRMTPRSRHYVLCT